MKLQLNGWQRIGVIVSILWFVAGGIWGSDISVHERTDWILRSYSQCTSNAAGPNRPENFPTFKECDATYHKQFGDALKGYEWEVLLFATVPIPLGWILAYGFIAVFRWVRRGFSKKV